jgi:hypothetical protein
MKSLISGVSQGFCVPGMNPGGHEPAAIGYVVT